MTLFQNIKLALTAIGGNITRTVITCLIIAIGIMALVGILTAIDGVESSLIKNFSFMGANSFNIQNRSSGFNVNRNRKRVNYESITYKQAVEFKDRFEEDGQVSVNANFSFNSTAKYKSEKTNPNCRMMGGDETYIRVAGYEIAEGRNITQGDVLHNSAVVVIGEEIKEQLFGSRNCLNQDIKVQGVRLRVVGVFASKGGAFDFGGDRIMVVPVSFGRAKFTQGDVSYYLGVATSDINALDRIAGYSENLFRQIRQLRIKEETNFTIIKSDSISKSLLENLNVVILGAIFIATITLLGAAIALMNIMLVSVTERTKEIGTRKAIGAKSKTVLNQFVIEAITICQIGGIGGIILGLLVGNAVSSAIGGTFVVPWNWISLAFVVCMVVGISAGIWPAYKASRINPIEALRHE